MKLIEQDSFCWPEGLPGEKSVKFTNKGNPVHSKQNPNSGSLSDEGPSNQILRFCIPSIHMRVRLDASRESTIA